MTLGEIDVVPAVVADVHKENNVLVRAVSARAGIERFRS